MKTRKAAAVAAPTVSLWGQVKTPLLLFCLSFAVMMMGADQRWGGDQHSSITPSGGPGVIETVVETVTNTISVLTDPGASEWPAHKAAEAARQRAAEQATKAQEAELAKARRVAAERAAQAAREELRAKKEESKKAAIENAVGSRPGSGIKSLLWRSKYLKP